MRRIPSAPGAPAPVGPYSAAVSCGGFLFLSGQVPLDPASGRLVAGDVSAQTDRVMENLAAVLRHAGASFSDVAKTTIFLTDMADFAAVNDVYARHVGDHRPARSTVQVSALPLGARVEIEMIARQSE